MRYDGSFRGIIGGDSMKRRPRGASRVTLGVVAAAILAVAGGLCLAGCGSESRPHRFRPVSGSIELAPPHEAVIEIGPTRMTGATYSHWMAIGAATVEMPPPTGPVQAPVVYAPPGFTACVKHLQENARKATTAQLQEKCKSVFESIQARILNFLITGYWLRNEAAEEHVSVTATEVRKKFEDERRVHFPTAAAFRRLQEASRQTIPDLEFAVKTQMLSAKLLERFTKRHSHIGSAQAGILAFNAKIRGKWIPRTSCRAGYVVPDCKQYHAKGKM
jgi:hypothetical protein